MPLLTPDQIIAGVCDPTGCTGGMWEFTALSGAALMTSVAILAFLYIWGSLFRNQQMNAYVKQELFEVMVTGVLILFLMSAVTAMSTLKVSSFIPQHMMPNGVGADTTVYAATAGYYERVDQDMSGWLNMNYVINMYIDQIASVTPYARPLGVGLVASPMAGLASPIKQLLYNMSTALSVAFIINYAQLNVYIFALQGFLKYYLPLGIFFRCFTPTRKLGGTLIGIAVTFLFVFPALSTITYTMFYHGTDGPLITFNDMASHFFGSSGPFQAKFDTFFRGNFTAAGEGLIDLMSGVLGGLGQLFETLIGGILLTILLIPIATVSWAFAIGFVIPAFNTILFVQAAKILSRSFGEEVDISSLTRLI